MKYLYKIKMVDGSRCEFKRDKSLKWDTDNPYVVVDFDDHTLFLTASNIISINVEEIKKGE